jgi:hypothetical protein
MRIVDHKPMERFRSAGHCSWCGKWQDRRQPHHVYLRRGLGGSHRIDLAINLIGLCRWCHAMHHAGQRPLTRDLLAVVAAREGVSQGYIEAEIARVRRMDKGSEYHASPKAGRGEGAEGDSLRDAGTGDQRDEVSPDHIHDGPRVDAACLSPDQDGFYYL